MNQNKTKLTAWMKFDGNGFMIGGTNTWRPIGVYPKDGGWVQIPGNLSNLCCGVGDSFIIVQNNSTNGPNPGATVTSLTTSDGRIQWTGTIAQSGGIQVFVIPNGYDETFTLTIGMSGTHDGVDVATSTILGSGTISAASPSFLNSGTVSAVFSTSAAPATQYLVVLSDD